MKKSLILACLFLGLGMAAQAQSFEATNFQPSFSKYISKNTATSIVGEKIAYIDYAVGSPIMECETIPDGKAVSLVNLLIKDPKKLQLSRTTANIICTTKGTIVIIYSNKRWEYLFVTGDMEATKGIRAFMLH